VTVKGNTGSLAKTGSAFSGWNTASDGSGTTYAQGQTFAIGKADVGLYAMWTTNPTFTVTYDANGATEGNTDPANCTAKGFRLPRQSEWELAARWRNDGTNTVAGFSDPWFTKGNSASGATAIYSDAAAAEERLGTMTAVRTPSS